MSNIAAAIGVEQMKKLDRLNRLRRQRAEGLTRLLKGVPGVEFLETLPKAVHVYQMFVMRVPAAKRDALVEGLRSRGVEASVHFDPPVHLQTFYKKTYGRVSLPITEKLAAEVVTLPLYPTITEREVNFVAASVRQAMAKLP